MELKKRCMRIFKNNFYFLFILILSCCKQNAEEKEEFSIMYYHKNIIIEFFLSNNNDTLYIEKYNQYFHKSEKIALKNGILDELKKTVQDNIKIESLKMKNNIASDGRLTLKMTRFNKSLEVNFKNIDSETFISPEFKNTIDKLKQSDSRIKEILENTNIQ